MNWYELIWLLCQATRITHSLPCEFGTQSVQPVGNNMLHLTPIQTTMEFCNLSHETVWVRPQPRELCIINWPRLKHPCVCVCMSLQIHVACENVVLVSCETGPYECCSWLYAVWLTLCMCLFACWGIKRLPISFNCRRN